MLVYYNLKAEYPYILIIFQSRLIEGNCGIRLMKEKQLNISNELSENEFEVLFRTYFNSLCFFSMKYVPDLDSAKEVVHSVFIKLWERRNELEKGMSLKSYLYTSVHNRSLNYIRNRKKFRSGEVKDEDFSSFQNGDDADGIESRELESKIGLLIEKLPEKCRIIFKLNRFEGLKYQEIADKLGISVKTVEAQMSKALRILREGLKTYLISVLILLWSIWNKFYF
jgi:RNA polymerase sigma-70 factor (ECF subfamily)